VPALAPSDRPIAGMAGRYRSVEIDAKPISALRMARTRQLWRVASARADSSAPTVSAPSAASPGKTYAAKGACRVTTWVSPGLHHSRVKQINRTSSAYTAN
jgi:hypothetical protein